MTQERTESLGRRRDLLKRMYGSTGDRQMNGSGQDTGKERRKTGYEVL